MLILKPNKEQVNTKISKLKLGCLDKDKRSKFLNLLQNVFLVKSCCVFSRENSLVTSWYELLSVAFINYAMINL